MQPVKMNDELIQGILQEFYAQASALGNLQTDKFSFNKNFSKPAKDAVEVNFTLEAYHEMCALIDHFSTEVAWHGLVIALIRLISRSPRSWSIRSRSRAQQ